MNVYRNDDPPDEPELPETCPVCGGPNHNEEADGWICPEAPGFCSVAHRDYWNAQQAAYDRAEAEYERQIEAAERAWDAAAAAN